MLMEPASFSLSRMRSPWLTGIGLVLLLTGPAAAQSIRSSAFPSKTQQFPEALARAGIERDSLMNLPRRLHTSSAGARSGARRRARMQRRLEERRASRTAVDHVARPPTLSAMTYAADEGDSLALVALYQSTDGSRESPSSAA